MTDVNHGFIIAALCVAAIVITLIVCVNVGSTKENLARTETDRTIQSAAIRAGLCQAVNVGNGGYHWDKCK